MAANDAVRDDDNEFDWRREVTLRPPTHRSRAK